MGHTVDIESHRRSVRLRTHTAYEHRRCLPGAIFRNIEIGHSIAQILDTRHLCIVYKSLRERCDGNGVTPQGILLESHDGNLFHIEMPCHRRIGELFDIIGTGTQGEQEQQKKPDSLHHLVFGCKGTAFVTIPQSPFMWIYPSARRPVASCRPS